MPRRTRPETAPPAPTFGMAQRSAQLDFDIRDKADGPTASSPHRHEYFQIQINLGAETCHHLGAVVRPLPPRALAFVLPHRLHWIPQPPQGHFVLINFSQDFLLPHLHCDPLDLEDIALGEALELAPFRFQEHLDFVLSDDAAFAALMQGVAQMRTLAGQREFGVELQLRGCLLQLIGLVCTRYQQALQQLAAGQAQRLGRRDALGRVQKYIRAHLAEPGLSLKGAAAAAFLSPNYLTHLLRKETGLSFTDLVLERRMRLACTQLLQGDKAISHIAWACGFADEAYFSRCFRKAQGLSPTQFRKTRTQGPP
jgi:AraC-like DNA-binding protein